MATVGERDLGVHGRAARLAWRTEILSLASQSLAQKLTEQHYPGWGSSDGHDQRGRDVDLVLIAASGLFDASFYLSRNEDVVQEAIPPLHHYLLYGGIEGRQPGPAFDAALYRDYYADVREAGINPILHYLKYGICEGRTVGTPDRHPVPASLTDVLRLIGDEWGAGIFEFPVSPPGQDAYAAVMAAKAEFEQRDASFRVLQDALERRAEALQVDLHARDMDLHTRETELSALRTREADLQLECAELRSACEGADVRLGVINASLQRVAAQNDALLGQHQACIAELEILRRERDEAANALHQARQTFEAERADLDAQRTSVDAALQGISARNDALLAQHQACIAELEILQRERDEAVDALHRARQTFEAEKSDLDVQRYVVQAALRRATARNDALRLTHDASRQEEERLRAELARRDADVQGLEEELVTMRAAVAAGRTELDKARSELATTVGELAIAARELMLTGRELQRLQSEEKAHLPVRAERDALRLRVATLEDDLQRGREQEAALIASRAEAAVLANEVRADAAEGKAVAHRLWEARSQLAGQLERMTQEIRSLRRGVEATPATGSLAMRSLYLDLLEATLTGTLTQEGTVAPCDDGGADPDRRLIDRDGPRAAVTMIGPARMRSLRHLLEEALDDGIEGDVLEAGVWRGGACIYMRGILAAHGILDRTVWVADSFAGPPLPDPDRYLADRGDEHHADRDLAVSLDGVRNNFERFGLLDRQVAFLSGWFKDTLVGAPIQHLAVLRLDGRMYGSTIETLEALYAKVSPGGFIVVGDYALEACRAAIDDYRAQYSICEPIIDIDGAAVYWRKAK